jgi:hypothetical protein
MGPSVRRAARVYFLAVPLSGAEPALTARWAAERTVAPSHRRTRARASVRAHRRLPAALAEAIDAARAEAPEVAAWSPPPPC